MRLYTFVIIKLRSGPNICQLRQPPTNTGAVTGPSSHSFPFHERIFVHCLSSFHSFKVTESIQISDFYFVVFQTKSEIVNQIYMNNCFQFVSDAPDPFLILSAFQNPVEMDPSPILERFFVVFLFLSLKLVFNLNYATL